MCITNKVTDRVCSTLVDVGGFLSLIYLGSLRLHPLSDFTEVNSRKLPSSLDTQVSLSPLCVLCSSPCLPRDVINFLYEWWCYNSGSCPVLQSREIWGQPAFPKRNIHHAESRGGWAAGVRWGGLDSKAGPCPEWPRSSSTHRSGKWCQRLFDLEPGDGFIVVISFSEMKSRGSTATVQGGNHLLITTFLKCDTIKTIINRYYKNSIAK